MAQNLGVPRKPTISPSKLTTYLACPVKYRWTYVDGRGKWYLRSKSYYSFGATLHAVLQRFHDSNDMGVTTTSEALAALDESWLDAGFTSAEEMAEAYGEGKVIVERHIEDTNRRPLTAKTLFVERQLRSDFGLFELIGRVDRVDEHEDGVLEIIDYKSGRISISAEQVQYDLPLACYQLLLQEKFPDRIVKATIVALRSGESASYSLSKEELRSLRSDVLLLGNRIITDEFHDFVPGYKPLCVQCDFLPLCRRHEEFAEAELSS